MVDAWLRLLPVVVLSLSGCGRTLEVSATAESANEGSASETSATSSATSLTNGEDGSAGTVSGDGESTGDVETWGDDDADTTATAGFIGGHEIIDPGPCSPIEQDCPEGEKCSAYALFGDVWDSTKCVEIMGDDEPGEPCLALGDNPGFSGLDSCDGTSICWDVDEDSSMGYCVAFCTGSFEDPVCEDDGLCAIYNDGVLPLCLPTCDPLAAGADCPQPDDLCVSQSSGYGFVCIQPNEPLGGYGEECMYINACQPGLFCADKSHVPGCGSEIGCCSEYCDVNAPNTCPAAMQGQECLEWFQEPVPGWEHVGGCAIP